MSLTDEFKKQAIEAFTEADYNEIYGLTFSKDPEEWTQANKNVLAKFLTANDGQVNEAKAQLLSTLKWRKEFDPLKAAKETFEDRFNKLGIVTKSPEGKVVTWNLYGAIANPGEVFKELDTFVRWRVALHEKALAQLDFADEKLSFMDQVHDYMNVSFLRMDSNIRKASSKVIELFQSYYPETLSNKFFVNVPYIMMWVFKLVRSITSEATTAKFHVLANGDQLAKDLGDWVPKQYGGKTESLRAISIDAPATSGNAGSEADADVDAKPNAAASDAEVRPENQETGPADAKPDAKPDAEAQPEKQETEPSAAEAASSDAADASQKSQHEISATVAATAS